jgi:Rod binding domain-containing protein
MTVSPAQPAASAPHRNDTAKLNESASQFEAFMLTEMLRSAWAGTGDEADSSVAEMAQEQFAQALAASGGLGMAKLVMKQLSRVS